MSLKMHDLTRNQVEKLIIEYGMEPAFNGQNPYIASGPDHEILVSRMAGGLYRAEILNKKEMEEHLQLTIKAFKEYTAAAKSRF
jgi:hypothetical protein